MSVNTNKIEVREDHARIILFNGEIALIDIEDVDTAEKYTWTYVSPGYAKSMRPYIALHDLIFGKAPPGFVTDHVNRNGLDCRKQNLRHVTRRENLHNKRHKQDVGINYTRMGNGQWVWRARITIDGKQIPLGCFVDIGDAITARKVAELKYLGYVLERET